MTVQDTDEFLVQRSGASYRETAANVKAYVGGGGSVPPASETQAGIAELATQAEVDGAVDDERIVTPLKLSVYVQSQLRATWLPPNNIAPGGTGSSIWNGPADTLTATPDVELRVASGTWSQGPTPVANGDQVQVRWLSAAVASAAHAQVLTGNVSNVLGDVTVDYDITIDKLPAPITINSGSGDPSTVVTSDASTQVTVINTAARLWLDSTDGTNAQVSINGGTWTAIPATAAAGLSIALTNTFRLRHTTQAGAGTVTTTAVRVGWDVASSEVASFITTNTNLLPLSQQSPTTVAGTAQITQTLTATPGIAQGGVAPLSYATRWQRIANGTTGWADISGATATTYVVAVADNQQYLRAVTTATDSTTPTPGTLTMASAATVQVTPIPLTELSPTSISGIAAQDQYLSVTSGVAQGGVPTISYGIRWQTSSNSTTGWADVAGRTGSTYSVVQADIGKYIRAVVTATDSLTPTGQTLELPSPSSAQVSQPPPTQFTWDGHIYRSTSDPQQSRNILPQVLMRRCLVRDDGTISGYLDADNSTKLAGDWLRLVEFEALSGGAYGAEVASTVVRGGTAPWAAGTYTKGARVVHNNQVWECLAATTTATPAAGTKSATLNGTQGQVMVEIPLFSVYHTSVPSGSFLNHTYRLAPGIYTGSNWQVHPAFVKPDATYRNHIYVGAYIGTGTNGNGSVSGASPNTTYFDLQSSRTACAGRGTGWHQYGFWTMNALVWLAQCEYGSFALNNVLGTGLIDPDISSYTTGGTNNRGNRSAEVAGTTMSYRGIEDFAGRARIWVDGVLQVLSTVSANNNPATWADTVTANYTSIGTAVNGEYEFLRDMANNISFLPTSIIGGGRTYTQIATTHPDPGITVVGLTQNYSSQFAVNGILNNRNRGTANSRWTARLCFSPV